MRQLARFQIEEHKAFQEVVVEDQVHMEVLGAGADALLPRHEGKVLAEFHQKALYVLDQRLLQAGFEEFASVGQS